MSIDVVACACCSGKDFTILQLLHFKFSSADFAVLQMLHFKFSSADSNAQQLLHFQFSQEAFIQWINNWTQHDNSFKIFSTCHDSLPFSKQKIFSVGQEILLLRQNAGIHLNRKGSIATWLNYLLLIPLSYNSMVLQLLHLQFTSDIPPLQIPSSYCPCMSLNSFLAVSLIMKAWFNKSRSIWKHLLESGIRWSIFPVTLR